MKKTPFPINKLKGIVSSTIEADYNKIISEISAEDKIEDLLLNNEIEKWRKQFMDKISVDNKPDFLLIAELWMRFVRNKIQNVIQYDTKDERESMKYRLNPKKIFNIFSMDEKNTLGYKKITIPLDDILFARRWFSKNQIIEGESLWELYKRYDPKLERKMNLGQFYTLLPKEWRKNYDFVDATCADCEIAEKWFKENKIIEGESLWELYKRYDITLERRMNLNHFHTLLPKKWRYEYKQMNATCKDCIKAEKWFEENKLIEGESLWELYKRYDPDSKRKMHLGQFYTLLPKEWRNKYRKIETPYKDCIKAEKWFEKNKLIEGESLWKLYKRYDTNLKRKMHIGHFYTLLPPIWRKRYEKINATCEDCVKTEKLYREVTLQNIARMKRN